MKQGELILGKPLRTFSPPRKATWAPVPNTVISWGDQSFSMDTERLPHKVYKALPPAFGIFQNTTKEQWTNFIRQCILHKIFT